jgi:hypothetical protein
VHIHGPQNLAAFELNSLYAAQAEAKQRAAETRRKLSEFASLMEAESEDCVVALSGREGSDSDQQERRPSQSENTGPDPEGEVPESHVSDWA